MTLTDKAASFARTETEEGTVGEVAKTYREVMQEHEEIATRAEPSQRYLNILSSLATGHLPWGVPWPGGLKLCGAEFVLCCGHTLTTAEANRLVLAGLLIPATTAKGEDGLAITDAGKVWLSRHWPCDPSDD